MFATATGGRQGASNIRNRVLVKAIERANEQLREKGEPPLPDGLTPHSLRRTFASVLYALGETPTEVMAQLGHTTPGLALRLCALRICRARGFGAWPSPSRSCKAA